MSRKMYAALGFLICTVVVAFGTLRTIKTDEIQLNDAGESFINILDDMVMDSEGKIRFEEASGNGSNYVELMAPNALSADATYRLPPVDGSDGNVLKTDGSGNMIWGEDAGGSTTTSESKLLENAGFTTSVGSSALTISLKTEDAGDPASGDKVRVGFRSATATIGDYDVVEISSALSLTVSSGSTLGQLDATEDEIFVYLVNNAGTALLAVSGKLFDEGSLQSTTAEGGAGAADSATVLYASSAVSDKAIRLIGRITNTQTTAGTWASAGSELSVAPFNKVGVPNSITSNGDGPFRVEYVHFADASGATGSCNDSTCTIYKESGDWVSTVDRDTTGSYTVNFQAGVFSDGPVCTANVVKNSAQSRLDMVVGNATTSGVSVFSRDTGGNLLDASVQMICIGPK